MIPSTPPIGYGGQVRPAQKLGDASGNDVTGETVSGVATGTDATTVGRDASGGSGGTEHDTRATMSPASQTADPLMVGASGTTEERSSGTGQRAAPMPVSHHLYG